MKRSALLKSWLATPITVYFRIDDNTNLGDAGLHIEAARKRAIAMLSLRRDGWRAFDMPPKKSA